MDIINASHFEEIQKFLDERPWWELKLSRNKQQGLWFLTLINHMDLGPFSVMPFIQPTLGESLRQASIWIGEQHAIQEKETKPA